jgi:hypothetical protein
VFRNENLYVICNLYNRMGFLINSKQENLGSSPLSLREFESLPDTDVLYCSEYSPPPAGFMGSHILDDSLGSGCSEKAEPKFSGPRTIKVGADPEWRIIESGRNAIVYICACCHFPCISNTEPVPDDTGKGKNVPALIIARDVMKSKITKEFENKTIKIEILSWRNVHVSKRSCWTAV